MSDDKKYSPVEVAKIMAERLRDCLQKHELGVANLKKSSNSAHEIDAGEEPNNDDAECPASLAANGSESSGNSESMDHSEYSEDSYSDEDEEESEEDKEKKKYNKEGYEETEEEETEEEDDFDFKKSEDCGYNITYKTMKKGAFGAAAGMNSAKPATSKPSIASQIGWPGAPKLPVNKGEEGKEDSGDKKLSSFDREKKDVEWTKDQNNMINATKPGSKKSDRGDQSKFIEAAKKRRSKMRDEGVLKSEDKNLKKCKDDKGCDCECDDVKSNMEKNTDQTVKATNSVDYDKPHKSDKDKENFKRPLEKCGDMVKKSEGSFDKLKRFQKAETKSFTDIASKKVAPPASFTAQQSQNSPQSKDAGQFVMQNAPKGSSRAASESFNQGVGSTSKQSAPQSSKKKPNNMNIGQKGPQKGFNDMSTPAKSNAIAAKEVGQAPAAKKRSAFGQAFDTARAEGKKDFTWKNPKTGKTGKFHTKHKEEMGQKQAPARQEQGNNKPMTREGKTQFNRDQFDGKNTPSGNKNVDKARNRNARIQNAKDSRSGLNPTGQIRNRQEQSSNRMGANPVTGDRNSFKRDMGRMEPKTQRPTRGNYQENVVGGRQNATPRGKNLMDRIEAGRNRLRGTSKNR